MSVVNRSSPFPFWCGSSSPTSWCGSQKDYQHLLNERWGAPKTWVDIWYVVTTEGRKTEGFQPATNQKH